MTTAIVQTVQQQVLVDHAVATDTTQAVQQQKLVDHAIATVVAQTVQHQVLVNHDIATVAGQTTQVQTVVGIPGPSGGSIDVTGPQGVQGIQGVKGDIGATGNAGAVGQNGVAGADSIVAGPQGETGAAGTTLWSDITDKPATFAPAAHGHVKADVSDFPTSMPASDVSAWAKAGAKPSYAYSEITTPPTLGTAAAKNIPAAGNASATEVVYGSDTRLADARTPSAHTHVLTAGATDVTATVTELNYVDGVTGNIQTQFTGKKTNNVSATDKILGRVTAGAGTIEEIACTPAGRALLDDADAAAQRATLGTAAYSEGTWTPVLHSFTLVGAAPPITGIYRRIGNLVFLTCYINGGSGGNTSIACTANASNITGIPLAPVSPLYATCQVVSANDQNPGVGYIGNVTMFPSVFSATATIIVISSVYAV